MARVIGYCKECTGDIRDTNLVPGTISIYECSKCQHPHNEEEIVDYESRKSEQLVSRQDPFDPWGDPLFGVIDLED
jgi:hypothetical protein